MTTKRIDVSGFVSARALAAILDLSPARIGQLVAEGLPREAPGKYKILECVTWYFKYLHKLFKNKGVNVIASEFPERARLLRADAELKELELAKKSGTMVSIEDVEREWSALVLSTKARVLAIPPRAAPELVGETSRLMIQAKLERFCKEALSALAKQEDPSASAS
jgi:phage terminase Nu1 subunit (DNA packaging protein)